MSYTVLDSPCTATFEIKKSQFLAYAYPLADKGELSDYFQQLQQTHPTARHICYAYIIGNPNNTTHAGFDDAGEPSGTAGRPILNVLQHKKIGNCVIFVVRYFGGIKLGAGGLTRAYSTATQLVVEKMNLKPFVAKESLTIITDFANEAYVRHQVTVLGGHIVDCAYGDKVRLDVELCEKDSQDLQEKLSHCAVLIQDKLDNKTSLTTKP